MSEPSFEQTMKQLEQLVHKLERGEAPLDEALAAFEQGMKLVNVCREQLKLAEVKVEKVMAAHLAAQQEEDE